MSVSCVEIVTNYVTALKEDFYVESHPLGCVIVTSFLRPDGDYIEILVEENNTGALILTDMGDTLAYLHGSGLALSRKLFQDARRISGRFGASLEVNEIVVKMDLDDVASGLHDLVQAAINVSALVEKRRPYMNLRFEEDVEAVIIGEGKRYDYQFVVNGQREPHTVKFHIDSGLNMLVQPFTYASETAARNNLERWNYLFSDILEATRSWNIIALLDDRGERKSIWASSHVTRPLEGLVKMIKWSDREEFTEALSRTQPIEGD